MWNKKEANKLDTGPRPADYMTLPFDHTEVSRLMCEVALSDSQEWDGWLTWNGRDWPLCDHDGVGGCTW